MEDIGLIEINNEFKPIKKETYSVLDCLRANQADIMICVTMYNEEYKDLERTLIGIW